MIPVLVILLTWLQMKCVKCWKLLCRLIVELKSLQLPTRCLFQKAVSSESCTINSACLRLAVDGFHKCSLHCKNRVMLNFVVKKFVAVWREHGNFLLTYCDWGQNMGSLLGSHCKKESVQWKHKTSPAPVKFCVQLSAGKVIATVFWDCHGILLVEYMAHKSSIIFGAYVNTLKSLRDALKAKHRILLSRGVMLLHDNAPVHKAKTCSSCYCRMWLSWNEPSTIQSRSGSVWLLPVQTFEKALAGTSIFKWHWRSSRCNVVAGGSGFWLLSCRNVIASGQVEQVHWTQRRLYWKKTMQCYFVKFR